MPRLALIFLILLFASVVIAQENICETTRRAALAESYVLCSAIDAGQACYGNSSVSAKLRSEGLAFGIAGDKVLLNDLASLTTASGENLYGMVYLRTTAYSPNTWESHELSLYLIGDATHTNAGQENLSVPTVTTTIIGAVGNSDVGEEVVSVSRGESETWRHLPNTITVQCDFDFNRTRILVGVNTIAGAVVMGDQTLSRPLHQLIAQRVDISHIRPRLLAPGASLVDIIIEFWSDWNRSHEARSRALVRPSGHRPRSARSGRTPCRPES